MTTNHLDGLNPPVHLVERIEALEAWRDSTDKRLKRIEVLLWTSLAGTWLEPVGVLFGFGGL